MKKNRILFLLVVLAASIGLLAGCTSASKKEETKKFRVVCTTFPQYDWVRQVIGNQKEQFELTLLQDSGVDLHSYQPTAEDIAKIGTADLFIYVGGESDGWVADALKEATNKNLISIHMMEVLGQRVKEEEIVEGMEAEEEEGKEEEETEEEPEYDEHVWLSLVNAEKLVENITDALIQIDEKDKSVLTKNSEEYLKQLSELENEYKDTVEKASKDTILFGDRFPFRYLADDYNLKYYAAFVGCSAETEASFETITFLAQKVDELGLSSILTIEKSDQKIANTIKENTRDKNQEILKMNSLQSITRKDLDGGETYLSVMKENRKILEKALNQEA